MLFIMMNPEAQEVFDKILSKLDLNEILSEYDRSFLKARRSYLSWSQRIKYTDVLYLNKQFLFYRGRKLVISSTEVITKVIGDLIIYLIIQFILTKF